MAHNHKVHNKEAGGIEKETNNEQEDSQFGLTNIGYLGEVNMLPLHIETTAGGATLLLALFGMFLIWRVTKHGTLKKMYHCCFRGRHQTVLNARREAENIEMKEICGSLSRINLPDVVVAAQQTDSIETQIRKAADRLNQLTLARSTNGARRGGLSLAVGGLPGATGLGCGAKAEVEGASC